jgi:DNA polymerase-3 subunit alpha/error-prone DNA polymerase
MNRFLTQHKIKNALPAQAPEFLNVSILYPIENTPDLLGF